MSVVKSINIADKTFNVTRASAVQQKKLMTLVGNRMLANSVAFNGEADLNRTFATGVLMGLDESTLDAVSGIVLYKTVEHGGESLVSLDTWQYGVMMWFELVAAALEYNLSDFFTWLDNVRKDALSTPNQK